MQYEILRNLPNKGKKKQRTKLFLFFPLIFLSLTSFLIKKTLPVWVSYKETSTSSLPRITGKKKKKNLEIDRVKLVCFLNKRQI
jgi:hypothetical protein